MNDDPEIDNYSFDTLAYLVTNLWIANAPENPTVVYLNNGVGYADESGEEPDLIAAHCTTVPNIGANCWVKGRNASGLYLYEKMLQCVYLEPKKGMQWFKSRA